MKELILMTLVLVVSCQCSAIKSEQSHHEHPKAKDHMGFFVSFFSPHTHTHIQNCR